MEIAALSKDIEAERDSVAVLSAEWSLLNRPERIERLAQKYLDLAPPKARQSWRCETASPGDFDRARLELAAPSLSPLPAVEKVPSKPAAKPPRSVCRRNCRSRPVAKPARPTSRSGPSLPRNRPRRVSETAKARAAMPDSANFANGRNRFRLICVALALSFVLIGGRLVTLGFAATEPSSGGLHDISSTVHRPDIFDRKGTLLATDIKSATLYADPARVIDRDELVEQVPSVLPDVNAAELRDKLKQGAASFPSSASCRRSSRPRFMSSACRVSASSRNIAASIRWARPRAMSSAMSMSTIKGLAGIEKFIDDNPQLIA